MVTKLPGFWMSAYQSVTFDTNLVVSEDQYKFLSEEH